MVAIPVAFLEPVQVVSAGVVVESSLVVSVWFGMLVSIVALSGLRFFALLPFMLWWDIGIIPNSCPLLLVDPVVCVVGVVWIVDEPS